MRTLLILVAVPVAISVGQLMFKKASATFNGLSPSGVYALLLDHWFLGAICLYGLSTIVWIAALRHVNISVAYQFMALTFVLVPMGGALFFGEHITGRQIAGLSIIIAGILFSNAG